jgi:hypothetical protein
VQLDPPVNLSPSHRIFLIGALYTVLVQHVVAKRPLHPTAGPEGPSPDLAYWLSRPAAERIEALRLQYLAMKPDADFRLQRVCRIAQLKRS